MTQRGVKANDLAIKGLRPRGREYEVSVREHRGLVVVVYPSGAKSFTLRYRQDGVLKRVGLEVATLAEARAEWLKQRGEVRKGEDPSARVRSARVEKQLKRQASRDAPTLESLAADFIKLYAKRQKQTWRADELMLQTVILPEWGGIKAKELRRRDIIDLLDRIAERTPVRANRILAVVRKMFNWAVERDVLDVSPCVGIKRPGAEVSRDRVLSDDEIRQFWNGLGTSGMPKRTQLALKLQLATAQRIGEIAGAAWAEFDHRKQQWLIPGSRTKNGRENLVPLSPVATEVLDQTDRDGEFLFPVTGKGGVLRIDVVTHQLATAIKKMEMAHFTSHDLRRTAATKLAELATPRVVIDAILNHKDRTVGAVYDRHDYMKEKRSALDAWSDRLMHIVSGKHATVTPLRQLERRNQRK